MEVCRLCLDLLDRNENFVVLNDDLKTAIHGLDSELNLEISLDPVICITCLKSVKELREFKNKCNENQELIKCRLNGDSDDQLSLKEILYGVNLGEIILTEKIKGRICRTCLESIDAESFTVLLPTKPDPYLNSMLTMCLSELDLTLSQDPVMCEKCLSTLQKLHHLMTTCLDVEEKLKTYCTTYGTNSSAQINLHNVLEALLSTDFVHNNIKTEILKEPNDQISQIHALPGHQDLLANVSNKELLIEDPREDPLIGDVKVEPMDLKTEETPVITGQIGLPPDDNLDPASTLPEINKCNICEKMFSTIWNLERHKAIHAGDKRYKCEECHVCYSQKAILEKHIRSRHTGERPFKCNFCPKAFTAKSNLNSHIKTHQGIRPYTCGICGHQFSQKSNLKKHILNHSGEKEKTFECEICHKMFSTKYNLQSHKEVHSGEKPYLCDICYEGFRHSTPLRVHRMTHFGKKPYTCTTCGMQFIHPSGLSIHEKTHLGNKPYACPVCNKRFVKESIVSSHLTLHTGEKPFECFMCGRKYADKSKLNYHLKKKCLKDISMSIKVR